MKRFQLKIWSKLLIGYAMLVGISYGIGIFTFVQISKTNSNLKHLYNDPLQTETAMEQIHSDFKFAQRLMQRIHANKTKQEIIAVSEIIQEVEKEIFSAFIELETSEIEDINGIYETEKILEKWSEAKGTVITSILISSSVTSTAQAREKQYAEDFLKAIGNLIHFSKHQREDSYYKILEINQNNVYILSILLLLVLFVGTAVYFISIQATIFPIKNIIQKLQLIAEGQLTSNLNINSKDEIGELAAAFTKIQNMMLQEMNLKKEEQLIQEKLQNAQNQLYSLIHGNDSLSEVSQKTINFIAGFLNLQIAVLYTYYEKAKHLHLTATYAISQENVKEFVEVGEGFIGQVALDKSIKEINDLPEAYFSSISGIALVKPRNLFIIPLIYSNKLVAVVELASIFPMSDFGKMFLKNVSGTIAIALNTALIRGRKQKIKFSKK